MNKKELERQKQNLIARGVGYILGYLFAMLLWGIVISVITVGIIAGFTWVIFWCFGWPWDIYIPIGIFLLAVFLKILFRRIHD